MIYIPLCLIVGAFIGWTLAGSRQEAELARLRALVDAEERRQAERRLERARGAS
ncbi:MAG: hypothetical protein IPL40_08515 [Proteobacteria bacterium]|nr:hypothetical protein [Pseudomonadota bacterium]